MHSLEEMDPAGLSIGEKFTNIEETDLAGLGIGGEKFTNIGVGSPNHADVVSTLNIGVPSAFPGEAVEPEQEP